jgi:hypothetical protein
MACEVIQDGTGHTIIFCRSTRKQTCKFCGKRPVSKLCDFPTVGRSKTCDAGMCAQCATSIRPGVDYCPIHRNQKPVAEQTSLRF